ncbi:ferredoxin-thioredoxin reductase catalytic domain-containing protein [Chloroflexota bacterium]
MNKKKLIAAFEEFTGNNDFMLNPDQELVSMVIDSLFANEKDCGLKLCPCRLRDDSRKRDLELICPCNFKSQDIWKTEGRCWCGLFVKR